MTWNYPLIIATLSAIFAGVGLFLAGGGLFLNWLAIKENNKTRQLQLLTDIFKSIKETEITLYKEYKNSDEKTKQEWDSLLFNTIELFAFLVNERFIKDKKIADFFNDAVVKWYEEIFLEHYEKEEVNNSRIFPEFKELYREITSKT